MNENQDAQQQATFAHTLYPPPPPVWKKFTKRNLSLLQELLEADLQDASVVDQTSSQDGQASSKRAARDEKWLRTEPTARLEEQTAMLRRLKGKARQRDEGDAQMEGDEGAVNTEEALTHGSEEDSALPDFDLQLELQAPRIDWIEEDGGYLCFNEHWPIHDTLAPLSSHPGMTQLYPDGPIDRKVTLLSLLRTMLFTYFKLSEVLQNPPRDYIANILNPAIPPESYVHLPPEQHPPPIQVWKNESTDLTEFIRTTVINMQHLLNEMRPAQAVENLRKMMREQLDRRKRETRLIRSKCEEMRASIATMRAAFEKQPTASLSGLAHGAEV